MKNAVWFIICMGASPKSFPKSRFHSWLSPRGIKNVVPLLLRLFDWRSGLGVAFGDKVEKICYISFEKAKSGTAGVTFIQYLLQISNKIMSLLYPAESLFEPVLSNCSFAKEEVSFVVIYHYILLSHRRRRRATQIQPEAKNQHPDSWRNTHCTALHIQQELIEGA